MVLISKYTKHAMLQIACKGHLACNSKHAKDNKHARDNKEARDNKHARDNKEARDNKQARCSLHIGHYGNMVQQEHIMQYSDGYSNY